MYHKNKEAIFGILSVVVLIVFFILMNNFKLQKASLNSAHHTALFNTVEGVEKGAQVRYSGIAVGEIIDIRLNEDYMAEVEIKIQKHFKVPEDSIISVATDGILGEKYLEITAGNSDEFLQNGGQFEESNSSADVMGLMKQVLSRIKL